MATVAVEEAGKRPFHQTIIEAIGRCSRHTNQNQRSEINSLLFLIIITKIPAGHDEIITALDEFVEINGVGKSPNYFREARLSLLEQKQEAEKKSKNGQKKIDTDIVNFLRDETEKLLSLLQAPQIGLISWQEFVRERIKTLCHLIS